MDIVTHCAMAVHVTTIRDLPHGVGARQSSPSYRKDGLTTVFGSKSAFTPNMRMTVRRSMLMAAMIVGSSLLAQSQTGEPAPAPPSAQVAVTSDAKPWWRDI